MQLWVRRAFSAFTVWAALLGALVLALAAAGMLPAREPAAPDVERFSVHEAITPPSPLSASQPSVAKPNGRFEVSWVPLCEAPLGGARLDRVQLFPGVDSLLVWCQGGYSLFNVSREQAGLRATRVARFKARGELPGGAAAGDFDGDGQQDLVLGVAPRPGVVHRSGSGAFWLRGRAQGGFEAARPLVETPTVALASQRAAGAVRDTLFVLTAGDVAAQRPAEIWLFGTAALLREKVFVVALDPRGLLLREGSEPNLLELWVLSGQPGGVLGMSLDLQSRELLPERAVSLPLRGAQAFGRRASPEGALFVRDTTSVYRLQTGPAPALVGFAQNVNTGPFAVTDLNGDQSVDLLAAIENGLAWIERETAPPLERGLPAGLRVIDVEILHDPSGQLYPLALVLGKPEANSLSLWLLPRPPWPQAGDEAELSLGRGAAEDAKTMAEVALD